MPNTWSSRFRPTEAGGGEGRSQALKPQGLLIAEAVLEANGIQDLADQIANITKAAIGNDLKFNVRVEFGGETAPPRRL